MRRIPAVLLMASAAVTDDELEQVVDEVDGRNDTRELLCSGYSGRVVLLNRPPGYGRKEQCDDPSLPRLPATRQCSCLR